MTMEQEERLASFLADASKKFARLRETPLPTKRLPDGTTVQAFIPIANYQADGTADCVLVPVEKFISGKF